jgi:hypothetical protein
MTLPTTHTFATGFTLVMILKLYYKHFDKRVVNIHLIERHAVHNARDHIKLCINMAVYYKSCALS